MENAPRHIPVSRIKKILAILDLVGIFVAFNLAYFLRFEEIGQGYLLGRTFYGFCFVFISSLYIFGNYELESISPIWEKVGRSFLALVITGSAMMIYVYFRSRSIEGVVGRGVMLGALAIIAVWSIGLRVFFHYWILSRIKSLTWLVVAPFEMANRFWQESRQSRVEGRLQFLVDDTSRASDNMPLIGHWEKLEEQIQFPWTGIIVGLGGGNPPEHIVSSLLAARKNGQRIIDLSNFYERMWRKVPVYYLHGTWFIYSGGFYLLHNRIGIRIKRLVDLLASIFLLILTGPLMLVTSALIRLESPGGSIFRQIRTGKDGRDFTIFKFRSMRADAEKEGAQWAVKKDPRVTRVGRWIRLTRIDELPQLFNVLKGEMSFIGPRPERPEFNDELQKDIPFYNMRNMVNPGITGWAQVNYSYGASVEDAKEKLQFELYYIKNYSLALDLAIVLKTIRVVLFGKGR